MQLFQKGFVNGRCGRVSWRIWHRAGRRRRDSYRRVTQSAAPAGSGYARQAGGVAGDARYAGNGPGDSARQADDHAFGRVASPDDP